MQKIESFFSFGGKQQIWQHNSETLNCAMNVAVYLPPQVLNKENPQACPVIYWLSGLTCTERNFIEKSGFQRYAAELGLIIVAPDTSPRGESVFDDESYDLGQGAGFYLNATQSPWDKHYQMYDYIVQELPDLINNHFPTNGKQSICGHSMGGHGALMIALKNPETYSSVSAFSPIVAPSQVPWGKKALTAYLGENYENWQQWDTCALLEQAKNPLPMLIDQGLDDSFLEKELKPELLENVAKLMKADVTINRRKGYDHSYYFIASFIGEHLAYHHKMLS
ncbi:S-formylglutathione hydrolase [Pasteurella atlantica]|uniref:S-formylglutathione hydrolase n=1 Tax=Pasteurellaceae TaxID=712 RepID=UPI0027441158|nr:S-formylglutathione hydrolase [Pasteurella atlantica]MDP8033583.1 S-formylglutathione hydrolase [Pasteurella atlantica]MDP8035637.1 S-formylglutathione hydrolase [Pasteurella atlantica]MDP8037588.1 S-formylglutathione hydrolase [Pasteurella atlantica]MDP8047937.1 S-formylglutathione hydrolase [Pasteurella atlantica]MDP8049892.1 S-formylglutathione hydrolase [Pasteurella atlantica]